ncbi:MAG: relaxase/mobilization nuclease domain-containing protein [Minwuiales bacterium]|nr:relaxase/mobilization nuclease domain-containing protein [Minwuiales bacterium]
MILKGNARGGAKDLALHLEKDENDHVEVYELRGFASENLMGALNEIYALSRGTKCTQFMYSLSLNPPETERVSTADFVDAIERCEKKLGLDGQARAIVFHEKEGRRHAHCVWSRIDISEMKAVQLSYDRKKLKPLSRELFLEHGWQMPPGLVKDSERDPLNFTLEEWQQAKRTGQSAKDIKAAIQDAWAISDNRASFRHALDERGFRLARGDKGRFVAVDHHGEVYSIPRMVPNVRTGNVRERLGDENALPSVGEVTAQYAGDMAQAMQRHKADLQRAGHVRLAELKEDRERLVERQRAERDAFLKAQRERQEQEAVARQARFKKGLGGLWDRLRGEHRRIREHNEREAETAALRDSNEKDNLIFAQLAQRRTLKQRVLTFKERYTEQRRELDADRAQFEEMKKTALEQKRDEFMKVRAKGPQRRTRRSRNRGPEPEL